ncbi:hypothetical protein MNEG_11084, partial [Monoraphidium neglectum]
AACRSKQAKASGGAPCAGQPAGCPGAARQYAALRQRCQALTAPYECAAAAPDGTCAWHAGDTGAGDAGGFVSGSCQATEQAWFDLIAGPGSAAAAAHALCSAKNTSGECSAAGTVTLSAPAAERYLSAPSAGARAATTAALVPVPAPARRKGPASKTSTGAQPQQQQLAASRRASPELEPSRLPAPVTTFLVMGRFDDVSSISNLLEDGASTKAGATGAADASDALSLIELSSKSGQSQSDPTARAGSGRTGAGSSAGRPRAAVLAAAVAAVAAVLLA